MILHAPFVARRNATWLSAPEPNSTWRALGAAIELTPHACAWEVGMAFPPTELLPLHTGVEGH